MSLPSFLETWPFARPRLGTTFARVLAKTGIRRKGGSDPALIAPFAFPAHPQSRFNILVCLHCYYTDVLGEALDLAQSLKDHWLEWLITTDSVEKKALIEQELRQRGLKGNVQIHENRGRDILPRLTALRTTTGGHDLILLIHCKKSLPSPHMAAWRSQLFTVLAGSRDIAASILWTFEHYPEIGMIAPRHHARIRPNVTWEEDYEIARRLATRMGFKLGRFDPMDFPSGSMLWTRPEALAPLLGLKLGPSDFTEEAGQSDGTTAHAIERLFFQSCELVGLRWLKVTNPILPDNVGGTPVKGPDCIARWLRDAPRLVRRRTRT